MKRRPGFTPHVVAQRPCIASQRPRAFTLIELLVVIAIIAILAAILFPVFAQAREKARQSACLSNCNQIGKGLMMYAQDYDERLPKAWYGPPGSATNQPYGTPGHHKWMDALYPYVKNQGVFTCPSDSRGNPYLYLGGPNPGSVNGGRNYGSYGMNAAYWGANDPYTPPQASSLAAIAVPADTVWAADTSNTNKDNFEFHWQFVSNNPVVSTAKPRMLMPRGRAYPNNGIIERHQETTTALWCDGHVKAMKLDKLAETHTLPNGDEVMHYFTIEAD
jgi:prepilin-type N-terminal cleavage/methylation domain-containing protein/prepilin-type processing-associated H-X9-DG protein